MIKFLFNIEPEMLKKIKKEAHRLEMSAACFIRKLISDYFQNK
jgi:hypothetical protein